MQKLEFKGTQGEWNYTVSEKPSLISIHTGDTPDEIDLGNEHYKDPTICGIWYADLSESIANAKLISAAPDLLKALQSIVYSEDLPNYTMSQKINISQAVSAIKKALQDESQVISPAL